MARGEQGFSVVIDPQEWFRLKKELDAFDPSLAKALRTRIRNAGKVAAGEVKKTLAMSSPGGGTDDGSSRAALIAATRVSVSFAKKAAGARIVTGSTRLAAKNKGLLNVYNKKTFRHPVFGDKSNWVAQKGRPYFGTVIRKALDQALVKEVGSALDEAMAAIGARGI